MNAGQKIVSLKLPIGNDESIRDGRAVNRAAQRSTLIQGSFANIQDMLHSRLLRQAVPAIHGREFFIPVSAEDRPEQ